MAAVLDAYTKLVDADHVCRRIELAEHSAIRETRTVEVRQPLEPAGIPAISCAAVAMLVEFNFAPVE